MKVSIHHKEIYGWVQYDPVGKEIMVSHPNEAVRNTVRDYLQTDRKVTVPGSNDPDRIGHRTTVMITPTDSKESLDMALTEMFHATGVHVYWGKADSKLYPDSLEDPDKKIIKSIFNSDSYEIIN